MKISILKQEAKYAIKEHFGVVIGTTLIFSLISLVLTLGFTKTLTPEGALTPISLIIYFAMMLFLVPLSSGITNTIVKISSNKESNPTEFINFSIKNFFKIWGILLRMIGVGLILGIIAFIAILIILMVMISVFKINYTILQITSVVLYIVFAIVLVIKILPYSFSFFILSETPEKKTKEITTLSKELFKGNFLNYILLVLSFIGWFLLITIITNIVYYFSSNNMIPEIVYEASTYLQTIFLTPYIIATQYAFYEEIVADKKGTLKSDKTAKTKVKE